MSDNKELDTKQNQEVTETEPKVLTIEEKVKSYDFNVGDTIIVDFQIKEGEKTRIQAFEGVVIGIKSSGISKTFTVRRLSAGGVGVERIFPLYSPKIDNIKVKSRGKVRRSKLYYLRDRIGKGAKIKEKRVIKTTSK